MVELNSWIESNLIFMNLSPHPVEAVGLRILKQQDKVWEFDVICIYTPEGCKTSAGTALGDISNLSISTLFF